MQGSACSALHPFVKFIEAVRSRAFPQLVRNEIRGALPPAASHSCAAENSLETCRLFPRFSRAFFRPFGRPPFRELPAGARKGPQEPGAYRPAIRRPGPGPRLPCACRLLSGQAAGGTDQPTGKCRKGRQTAGAGGAGASEKRAKQQGRSDRSGSFSSRTGRKGRNFRQASENAFLFSAPVSGGLSRLPAR